MNNLFLNDSRYMSMDNWQPPNSDLSIANNSNMLGKIKLAFFQYFESAVDDCCMRIEFEFGAQLGKNREKYSKDQYIKLLQYLRSIREELKQNYLRKVHDIFDGSYQKAANNQDSEIDFSKVLLSNDAMVKENHAVALIVSQCEHSFYEELASFTKHFALSQGKQSIADSQNPIFPEKLIRALVEVVKPLKLTSDGRIALYKTFETNVFSQLGFIYRELIKCCEITVPPHLYVVGEIKETVKSALVSTEQPSSEFRLLQKKLGLWRLSHSPSAYDLIAVTSNVFYEHFEIINALQILQQFKEGSESGENTTPLKSRVLKKLQELSFSDKVKNIDPQDEDVLDLVSLIFSEIARDELLPDAIKTAVLQLEIPLAAASLGQYSIFTCSDNPVRQLLDDLYSAGQFLNLDEYDDRLIQQRIIRAVKNLTGDSGFELFGWITEAGEFLKYLNKQTQHSQNIEQNIRQLMINQQSLESSRKIVFAHIENSINGKALPIAIVDFLRNVWSVVLQDVYTRKDEQPEQWAKAVQAMDELIVSVIPPTDDNQRKHILKLLPGLIAELRKGLKQISYDKSAQSRFFKDLAVWHIILMDKKEVKKPVANVGTATVEDQKIKAIADHCSEQVKNLAVESWVVFTSEPVKQWGKLLWNDADTGAMLFVGKNGVKIFELQEVELIEKLRIGQAFIVKINEKAITERVLSELMN